MKNTYCVIMAGGIGSRFWPMSTNEKPKQFLDILGVGKSLLRQTYERSLKFCEPDKIIVVTNKAYKHLVHEQIPEINESQVLLEPLRRNTAPCIAFASYKLNKLNPNATFAICPSDHLVLKEDVFEATMKLAISQARQNNSLVTLGIKPNRPDTGYGYIQFTETSNQNHKNVRKVITFTEKPNLDLANEFLESGDFYWNSGIFVWTAKTIIQNFDLHLHDIHTIFSEGEGLFDTEAEQTFLEKAFQQCPNISIDYGIMEKAENVDVVLADFGWSDLGTWGSLYEHCNKDANQNAANQKQIKFYQSNGNIVNMPNGKTAVIQGLDEFIVVDANNTLLICKKENEQLIKQFVIDLKLPNK